MDLSELDYALPEERIAQRPMEPRSAARLLVLDRGASRLGHHRVADLPSLIAPSLLVVNDTRVIPARLFGARPSGGKVELLLLERRSAPGPIERWAAMGRANKPLREGAVILVPGGLEAVVRAREEGPVVELELRAAEGSVGDAIDALGRVPLPPYIRREPTAEDRERYQTVFATHEGAVAAPTAGLHFDEALLAHLEAAGHVLARVTLHVGPGTFRPVSVERLDEHAMHSERWIVSEAAASAVRAARAEGRPVIAVGTTVVRALESALVDGEVRAGEGATELFIRPPHRFQAIDGLLTNFHLPRSTLLALVMALGGVEPVRAAYAEAVRARYRFYSYGDAMLVRPPEACP